MKNELQNYLKEISTNDTTTTLQSNSNIQGNIQGNSNQMFNNNYQTL